MSKYEVAMAWADLNDKTFKIIGQFCIPSDPGAMGSWVYFPLNATHDEVIRQRDLGHLLTTTARTENPGPLLLLAKRPKKKHELSDFGPRGFKYKASWV